MRKCTLLKAERGCFYEEENYTAILSGAVAGDCHDSDSAAISTKAISGKPTLKIEGTTAYCVGKYNSGNRNDAISITVTLMQGSKEIASWSASGKGSVTISKTCKVETKKTYKLVLSATVNGVAKPDVSVTATAK